MAKCDLHVQTECFEDIRSLVNAWRVFACDVATGMLAHHRGEQVNERFLVRHRGRLNDTLRLRVERMVRYEEDGAPWLLVGVSADLEIDGVPSESWRALMMRCLMIAMVAYPSCARSVLGSDECAQYDEFDALHGSVREHVVQAAGRFARACLLLEMPVWLQTGPTQDYHQYLPDVLCDDDVLCVHFPCTQRQVWRRIPRV